MLQIMCLCSHLLYLINTYILIICPTLCSLTASAYYTILVYNNAIPIFLALLINFVACWIVFANYYEYYYYVNLSLIHV